MIMKRWAILVIISLIGLFLVGGVWAQPQGPGMAPGWGRMYDPKTIETLKGEIASVDIITAGRMDIPGRVILNLKTAKETVMVYLGPEWYMKQQEVKLVAGDQVEVKGSRVSMEGKPYIIPNYVKKNDRMLNLRDDTGMPLWAGKGMGKGMKGK
jgi:hypothetical protein